MLGMETTAHTPTVADLDGAPSVEDSVVALSQPGRTLR